MLRRAPRTFSHGTVLYNGGWVAHEPVTIGWITDLHYADQDDNVAQDLYYRDASKKVADAVSTFNTANVDFIVECGDLIDNTNDPAWYTEAVATFSGAEAPVKHVIGNHDISGGNLTRSQIVEAAGMPAAYYSFDCRGIRFAVLDSSSGTVPADQLAWLASVLRGVSVGVVILHHELHDEKHAAAVTNAVAVRAALEAAGNVVAVFCGHAHRNASATINGITYISFQASTRGAYPQNAYAIITVDGRSVSVEGFGGQNSYA